MENRDIAAVFEEISNLLKINQDDPKWPFKAAAYERAKRAIEGYSERLADIARNPQRKLTEIPGIGEDLAKKITELVETGQCKYHQEQLRKVPRSLLDLLQLQTVGPQKVRLFKEKLGITTVDGLEKAAKEGRLRALPGMSVKSEENVLKAIDGLPPRRGALSSGYRFRDRSGTSRVSQGIQGSRGSHACRVAAAGPGNGRRP